MNFWRTNLCFLLQNVPQKAFYRQKSKNFNLKNIAFLPITAKLYTKKE